MEKVLIGLQVDATTEATKFTTMKAVNTDLTYGITEVVSQAVTDKEWAEQGVVSVGSLSGTLTVELTRKSSMLLLEVGGFDKDDKTADAILNAPKMATYKYCTIVREFTDESGNSHYDKHIGCIINVNTTNIMVDQFVQATLTPISLSKGISANGKFIGTIEDDTDDLLICEKTIIKFDAVTEECELTTFDLEINNNLSTEKAICGDYILQKSPQRVIKVSTNTPRLKSNYYMTEFEKAKKGQGIAAEITLKVADDAKSGETLVITLPKITYTELNRNTSGNGSLAKGLAAKWDTTTDKVATFTYAGMGTGA